MSNLFRFALPAALILWPWTMVHAQQGGPPLFSVRTAPARSMEIAPTLEFTGSIEPWRIIELSSQVEGLVENIPIEEGQRLAKGDLVCELDTERVEIEILRHRAQVERASAELDRLETGYRVEEIEETRKTVEANRQRFLRAQDDWERIRPLVEQGVSPKSEGTRVETALLEAEATLQSSEARLRLLMAGYRVEEISKARADAAMEDAFLKDYYRQLRRHRITAPATSVVTERMKEPGEWVDLGDPIARLVVLDPLKVRLEVPQLHLNKVKPGQEAILKVDGYPQREFHAKVDSIVPYAGGGTRNFPVLMKLDNSEGLLSSGLFARVLLMTGEEKPEITVPDEALLIRGENLVVLVADPIPPNLSVSSGGGSSDSSGESPEAGGANPDARIRVVVVETGPEIGGFVTVTPIEGGPIKVGDEVVVLGGQRLVTGMPVRIIREEAAEEESGPSAAAGGIP